MRQHFSLFTPPQQVIIVLKPQAGGASVTQHPLMSLTALIFSGPNDIRLLDSCVIAFDYDKESVEERCKEEFIKDNIPLSNSIDANKVPYDVGMKQFYEFLEKAVDVYPDINIVLNDTLFDMKWIRHHLLKSGHKSLLLQRCNNPEYDNRIIDMRAELTLLCELGGHAPVPTTKEMSLLLNFPPFQEPENIFFKNEYFTAYLHWEAQKLLQLNAQNIRQARAAAAAARDPDEENSSEVKSPNLNPT